MDIMNSEMTQSKTELIRVERLEYGKFCISGTRNPVMPVVQIGSDGMVVEHQVLGKTKGFPDEIAEWCLPNELNVKTLEGETVPENCPHGTVLRPIVPPGASLAYPVFYRLRKRAEKGEGVVDSRQYTLGRYLTVAGQSLVTPQIFLSAMDRLPLKGLTESDSIDPIYAAPLEILPSPVLWSFARAAAIFVLSGIPVSILPPIDEKEFFEYVTALWKLLPPSLRPFLSAGWGVGNAFSGRLTVSYTVSQASTCALFSPQTGKWDMPRRVAVIQKDNQISYKELLPDRLAAGDAFAQLFFPADMTDNFQLQERTLLTTENLESLAVLSNMPLSILPDWSEPSIIRNFRAPGLKSLDEIDYTSLSNWLESDDGAASAETGKPKKLNAQSFIFNHTRHKALQIILDAMHESSSEKHADLALWESLKAPIPPMFEEILKDNEAKGKYRARLFASLRRAEFAASQHGEFVGIFEALCQAAQADEVKDLPVEAANLLRKMFDDSLASKDSEVLSWHGRLLSQEKHSKIYLEWISQNNQKLILNLASVIGYPEIHPNIKDRIANDFVDAILNLTIAGSPTDENKAMINQLPKTTRREFNEVLRARWEINGDQNVSQVEQRREKLLQWVELLNPVNSGNPLWRLKLNEEILPEHIQSLADEIENKAVPKSLKTGAAVAVLQNWSFIDTRAYRNYDKWKSIILRFPLIWRKVLFPNKDIESDNKAPHAVRKAADNLKVTLENLKYLIRQHEAQSQRYPEVFPLLWKLATRSVGYSAAPKTAGELCGCFQQPQLPISLAPADSEIKSCAKIFHIALLDQRFAAEFEDYFKKHGRKLWEKATIGWHLMFLLTLFPEEEFVPKPEQLAALIPHRDWLRKHVEENTFVPRKRDFICAMFQFHSLSYAMYSGSWHDSMAKTGIWAIFKGVPIEKIQAKGTLSLALKVYSSKTQYELEEQADYGWRFLKEYENKDERQLSAAVSKAAFECLFPLLDKRLNDEYLVKRSIDLMGKAIKNSAKRGSFFATNDFITYLNREEFALRKLERYVNLHRLLEKIVVHCGGASVLKSDYKDYRKQIEK